MRLYCWFCGKSVSNEVPDDTVVRAVCVCPECVPQVITDEDVMTPTANTTGGE